MQNMETVVVFIFYFCNEKCTLFSQNWNKSRVRKKTKTIHPRVSTWSGCKPTKFHTYWFEKEGKWDSDTEALFWQIGAWRWLQKKEKKDILKILAPPQSWQKPYKYATWNIQHVCLTLRGQDTQTPLMSPGDWQRWWQQPSHLCLFWSISVTGQPGLPFVHRRGEEGPN